MSLWRWTLHSVCYAWLMFLNLTVPLPECTFFLFASLCWLVTWTSIQYLFASALCEYQSRRVSISKPLYSPCLNLLLMLSCVKRTSAKDTIFGVEGGFKRSRSPTSKRLQASLHATSGPSQYCNISSKIVWKAAKSCKHTWQVGGLLTAWVMASRIRGQCESQRIASWKLQFSSRSSRPRDSQ